MIQLMRVKPGHIWPQVYRDGANDGFHEAIGELMAMTSATPRHLYDLGLLDSLVEDEELDINFLLSQALITVSTLPFHLTNDLWRWRLFRGEVSHGDPFLSNHFILSQFEDSQWNAEYWKLKFDIVGVFPPVERTAEDLDPPCLYHINQDYNMIMYFVRTILQFQFADKLCQVLIV